MNTKLMVSALLAGTLLAIVLLAGKVNIQSQKDSQQEAWSTSSEAASAGSTKPPGVQAEVPGAPIPAESQNIEERGSPITDDTVDSPKWPDAVEDLILNYLSQLKGFEFTSITSVQCDVRECEVVFTGLDPNPVIVDDYSDVMNGLFLSPINAKQGSVGTREIAAGAREFVISISNVPYVRPESTN